MLIWSMKWQFWYIGNMWSFPGCHQVLKAPTRNKKIVSQALNEFCTEFTVRSWRPLVVNRCTDIRGSNLGECASQRFTPVHLLVDLLDFHLFVGGITVWLCQSNGWHMSAFTNRATFFDFLNGAGHQNGRCLEETTLSPWLKAGIPNPDPWEVILQHSLLQHT